MSVCVCVFEKLLALLTEYNLRIVFPQFMKL